MVVGGLTTGTSVNQLMCPWFFVPILASDDHRIRGSGQRVADRLVAAESVGASVGTPRGEFPPGMTPWPDRRGGFSI